MTSQLRAVAPEGIPKSLILVATGGLAAMIVLVLVLAGTIPLLQQATPTTCQALECGTHLFLVGNPVEGTCSSGGTFATTGCSAGEFVYNLTIEESSISFGDVRFHIDGKNGSVLVANGVESGFSVLSPQGAVVAQYKTTGGEMSMSSGWTYSPGTNSSTSLTMFYWVLVNVGTVNPSGQGCLLTVTGTGAFTGTEELVLP